MVSQEEFQSENMLCRPCDFGRMLCLCRFVLNCVLYVEGLRKYWGLGRPWDDVLEFCVKYTLSMDHGAKTHMAEVAPGGKPAAATAQVWPVPVPDSAELRKNKTSALP